MTIGYGVVFLILLCGCCDCRPRRKRVDPVQDGRRDSDVKTERDRVANKLMYKKDGCRDEYAGESGSGDLVLVRDLVKKYFKKDPEQKLDQKQDYQEINLGDSYLEKGKPSG